MGLLSSVLSAQLRGKVGAFNFRVSKGQNIASAYQPKPRNPKTPAQMFQRKKVELVQDFYRLQPSAFKLGYRQTQNPLSPVNGFMSQNMKNAIDGTNADDAALDYSLILASKGNMGATEIVAMSADNSTGQVTIEWDGDTVPVGGSDSDLATVVLIDESNEESQAEISNVIRTVGEIVIDATIGLNVGQPIRAYLFFRSVATNAVSDSRNQLAVVVA